MKVEEIKPYTEKEKVENKSTNSEENRKVAAEKPIEAKKNQSSGDNKPEKKKDKKPQSNGDKGLQVKKMFDSIARRYDLMNTAMSMCQHKRWRNKALKEAIKHLLPQKESFNILDIATGTGDVAFRLHQLIPDATITGIDLSDGMLKIAQKKLDGMKKSVKDLINFRKGDSLSLPFHNGDFNMVTVAYGVRNFSDIRKSIREMRRVLKPNGVLCIIELSTPTGPITKKTYDFYSKKVIPWMGEKIAGDRKAYTYLQESIAACPQRDELASLLEEEGFSHVEWHSLTFGALTYYIAK